MSLLVGALTMGLILAVMALGVFLSFRIFGFADLATDSVLTLGASVAAVLLVAGASPGVATAGAVAAGAAAGGVTGFLHTKLRVNNLLSGILVMTGLYSVNLRVLGGSNVSLSRSVSLVDRLREVAQGWAGAETIRLSIWEVPVGDLALLGGSFLLVVLLALAYVATGRLDAYIEEQISLWDIAAGQLLVESAGGAIVLRDSDTGAPGKMFICASSGKIPLDPYL